MADTIQGLIEKIQEEGIKQAERKARAIEDEARKQAEQIIAEATRHAQQTLEKTAQQIEQLRANSEASLQQAGRNLLLSVRQEINDLLNKIMRQEISNALRPEELEHILVSLIKGCAQQAEGEIVVSLSAQDHEKLKEHLIARLGSSVSRGISVQPSDGIQAGFTISFDSGKSQYDFSDEALARYLGLHLKPALAEILGRSAG